MSQKNGDIMFSKVKIREGHDNFFTPIRLLFALMVLIGHAFVVIGGHSDFEPEIFFEYTPSYLAVNLFFVASGFLVTKSMLYREDLAEYGAARFLRIFPALFIHVLFVMFAIGPFVTNMPILQFFADPAFWTQPFQVLTFYQTEMILPGAFSTNHEQIGSAALWTLRYEVLAYIGTAIAFALGLLKHRWMLIAQFVIFAFAWPLAHILGIYDDLPGTLQSILRFGLAYGLGAAIYALKDKLSFHALGIFILGLVTALFNNTVFMEVFVTLWLGYIVFWMAYVKIPALNGLKKLSDTSYGIYIYHWVVLQTLYYYAPGLNIWQLLLLALPATTAFAYASWHLVESPMLRKKTTFAKFLKARLGKANNEIISPAE